MAPLLSDKELISCFTEKQVEYHTWYQVNARAFHDSSFEAKQTMLKKRWPKRKDQRNFYEWMVKWNARHTERLTSPMTAPEFVELVCATDVTDPSSLTYLLGQMEFRTMPLVPLGQSDFGGQTGYALCPCAGNLWPSYEDRHEAGLLERILLAINTDIAIDYQEPRAGKTPGKRPLEYDFGESLIRHANSSDIDRRGTFVFLQIGILYACDGWDLRTDPLTGPWRPTGFAVVVRVDTQGKQIGVYLIFNFYEVINGGDENWTPRHIPVFGSDGKMLPHIGQLNKGVEAFTIARIANSLDDLRAPRRFTVDIQKRNECQIVRVKMINKEETLIPVPQFVS